MPSLMSVNHVAPMSTTPATMPDKIPTKRIPISHPGLPELSTMLLDYYAYTLDEGVLAGDGQVRPGVVRG